MVGKSSVANAMLRIVTGSLVAAVLGLSSSNAAELTLVTTNAARGVMNVVLPAFEKSSGHKVDAVFGVAATLKTRLEGGERFDVVILGPSVIDGLIMRGKAWGPNIQLAIIELGLSVRSGAPKPDISTDESLKASLLGAKSISYSDPSLGGFSAVYFTKMIANMGIADALRAKTTLVQPGDGGSLVAKGEIEFGVAMTSEIAMIEGIEAVSFRSDDPASSGRLNAAISSRASDYDAANALLGYLRAAKESFRSNGMKTP